MYATGKNNFPAYSYLQFYSFKFFDVAIQSKLTSIVHSGFRQCFLLITNSVAAR